MFNNDISKKSGNPAIVYDHETLALLLHHLNLSQWQIPQLYLAAGSEDLAALLPKLDLRGPHSEAFIVVRAYVHTMLVYCQRQQDKLNIYVFESQGWGLRFYPTRLILRHLHHSFTDARIYLSHAEVQSQDLAHGCIDYTLCAMDYLLIHSDHFFKVATSGKALTAINHYANSFLLDTDPCTTYLQKSIDIKVVNDRHANIISKLLLPPKKQNCCSALLYTFFGSRNTNLNTSAALRALSGMDKPDISPQPPHFCTISVDTNECSVTLQFADKNYLYTNLIAFSQEIYPQYVKHDMEALEIIYSNHAEITTEHDHQHFRITFSASTMEALQQGLQLTAAEKDELYHLQMRQLLAITLLESQIQQKMTEQLNNQPRYFLRKSAKE